MKKEEFKNFIKRNPELINYVKSNEMTWQKFYEIYDLYGEESNVWENYINKKVEKKDNVSEKSNVLKGLSIGEFISWLKNVDLDGLQEGIGNVQRVLGVVTDLAKSDSKNKESVAYKPRPLYRHFED